MTFITEIYDLLGKPSLISTLAAILSFYAVGVAKKNKNRNDFINGLMQKTLMTDKDKLKIEDLIEQNFLILGERLNSFNTQLNDLKNIIYKVQEEMKDFTIEIIKNKMS